MSEPTTTSSPTSLREIMQAAKPVVFLFEIGALLHDVGKLWSKFVLRDEDARREHPNIMTKKWDDLLDVEKRNRLSYCSKIRYLHARFVNLTEKCAQNSHVAQWSSADKIVDPPPTVFDLILWHHRGARSRSEDTKENPSPGFSQWINLLVLADRLTSGDDRCLQDRLAGHLQQSRPVPCIADAFGHERPINPQLFDKLRLGDTTKYAQGTLYGELRRIDLPKRGVNQEVVLKHWITQEVKSALPQLRLKAEESKEKKKNKETVIYEAVENVITLAGSNQPDDLAQFRQDVYDCVRFFYQEHLAYTEKEAQPIAATWRAVNDISLYDHSHAVATWAKALLANVVLGGNPLDGIKWEFPQKLTRAYTLYGIKLNTRSLLLQAHRPGDLVGRQELVRQAKEKLQALFEVDFAIGNLLFGDDERMVFLLPPQFADGKKWREKLDDEVSKALSELSPRLACRVLTSQTKKNISEHLAPLLDKLASSQVTPSDAEREEMEQAWCTAGGTPDRCSVCLLRPVQEEKLPDEGGINVCSSCARLRKDGYRRRFEEMKEEREKGKAETVWMSQIADDERRLAALLLHVPMHDWLNGRLVRAQRFAYKGDDKKKVEEAWNEFPPERTPSYERLRRLLNAVGEWVDEVREHIVGHLPLRTGIHFEVSKWEKQPGFYPVKFMGLTEGRLQCLNYSLSRYPNVATPYFALADVLPRGKDPLRAWMNWMPDAESALRKLEQKIEKGIAIYDPDTNRPVKEDIFSLGNVEASPYRPYAELIHTQQTLALLVPADQAFDFAMKIEESFREHFPKQAGKLAPCLGLIYAHHKFPLYVILDALYRMLDNFDRDARCWDSFVVESTPTCDKDGYIEFTVKDAAFGVSRRLRVDACFRSNDTGNREPNLHDDIYTRYPVVQFKNYREPLPFRLRNEDGKAEDGALRLCLIAPLRDLTEKDDGEGVLGVKAGDTLALQLGRFAFLRLTAASQRFASDSDLYHVEHPYRFADIAEFQRMWRILHDGKDNGCQSLSKDLPLTRHQLRNLYALLENKALEWKDAPEFDTAYRLLVENALREFTGLKPESEVYKFLLPRLLNRQFLDFCHFFETVSRSEWDKERKGK